MTSNIPNQNDHVEITPYTIEYVVKHLATYEEVFTVAYGLLTPAHFCKPGESIYRIVWEHIISYHDEFAKLPDYEVLSARVQSEPPVPGMLALAEIDQQNRDDLIRWIYNRAPDLPLPPEDAAHPRQDDVPQAKAWLKALLLDRAVWDRLKQPGIVMSRAWADAGQIKGEIEARFEQENGLFTPIDLSQKPAATQYVIDGLFTSDQNCVIAGGMKCLKTTFSTYLGVCIGCGPGVRVFGRHDVIERRRVAIFSGEAGRSRLWEHVYRALAAVNRKRDECCIEIYDRVPAFDNPTEMEAFTREIRNKGHQLVIVDPWSKAAGRTGADKAANTMLGVQLLGAAERAVNDAGAQLWLNDHMSIGALKARENGRKTRIQLHDVNYGATMKWARQWMLITRNKDYGHDGRHDMYIEIGGDAGQDVAMDMDIDESGVNGMRQLRIEVRQRVSGEELERRQQEHQCELDQRMLSTFGRHQKEGATVNKVLDETVTWQESKAVRKASAYRLVESGSLQPSGRKYRGGTVYVASGWVAG